jgi:hypothetical protein
MHTSATQPSSEKANAERNTYVHRRAHEMWYRNYDAEEFGTAGVHKQLATCFPPGQNNNTEFRIFLKTTAVFAEKDDL